MTAKSLWVGAIAAAASFGLAHGALASGGATVTSVSTGQTYATPTGQTLVVDFQSGVNSTAHTVSQNGVTGTGVYTASTSVDNQYAAPSGDSTVFAYVSANPANGSATFNFSTAITSLSLLWGSIDSYNTIAFSNGGTIAGSDVIASPNGSQDPNGTKLVNISFATPVTSATFSSTQNSFEFDNLAVTAAPEPGTWALMLGGVAFLGFALRSLRRREGVGAVA